MANYWKHMEFAPMDRDSFHLFKILNSYGTIREIDVISMWLSMAVIAKSIHGYFMVEAYNLSVQI
jgi:hypothetical protein